MSRAHSSRVVLFWVIKERESWEVLKECWGNYTHEYMNELIIWMYLWMFWLSSEMIVGILFSYSLHVIPEGSVLNHNTALCTAFTGISCNSASPYKVPPAVGEWIYRLTFTSSLCAVSVWPKTDRICMYQFWPVDEKQAYDSRFYSSHTKLYRI